MRTNRSLAVAVTLCLTTCALASCRATHESDVRGPQPPDGEVWLNDQQVRDARVEIQTIGTHTVGDEVATSGKIAFDDLRVGHVFSPVFGRVKRILADPGQRVKREAPLAVIDSPDVGNAFADLGKAQADLTAAEHEVARQHELFEAHASSQKDSETAQDNYAKAKAEMNRARQRARLFRAVTADAASQEFTLRAPIDGEVIARNINPGAEVQGQYSGGTPVELFTIGELDRVWVLADVFEMDLAHIRKDAPVVVKVVAYPDQEFHGKVEWISDLLDPATRTARVRCSIENPARALKPEMYATMTIRVSGDAVLAVPRSAVLRIADQTVVFVDAGRTADGRQRFVRRVVALNENEGADYVPVVRGVAARERLVTSGGILLSGML